MKTLVAIGVMSSVVLAFGGRDQNVANWSMSGRVVDAATGRPIAGASVTATLDSRPGRNNYASSDANGAYHFDRLQSGSYFVYATVMHRTVDVGGKYRLEMDPPTLMSLVRDQPFTCATTFHPSALTSDGARRVVIDAGRSHPGIDVGVRRVPTRRVTGTVVGPRFHTPDGPGELLKLLSADDVRFHLAGTASTLTQDGPFVFMAVPPGTYTIEAWEAVHGDMVPAQPQTRMVNALTVGDADVSGVTVTVPVR